MRQVWYFLRKPEHFHWELGHFDSGKSFKKQERWKTGREGVLLLCLNRGEFPLRRKEGSAQRADVVVKSDSICLHGKFIQELCRINNNNIIISFTLPRELGINTLT